MNKEKGKILSEINVPVFNIERFAISDGPGIRTVVFLQGCPLRCPWCANPESQTIGKKLMRLESKCIGCGLCVSKCQSGALTLTDGKVRLNRERCTCCEECVRICPNACMEISGQQMYLSEIKDIILRDKEYYIDSGGGVTFSGGEALIHFDKLFPLIGSLRESGINIAFETCGQVDEMTMAEAGDCADLFLFDVKSSEPEKFKRYTGGSLECVLDNLTYLASRHAEKIMVRIPVIPGFNYERKDIYDIFLLIRDKGIKRAQLLPYHTLGRTKYEQLGLEYRAADKPLNKNDLEIFREEGKNLGLEIII